VDRRFDEGGPVFIAAKIDNQPGIGQTVRDPDADPPPLHARAGERAAQRARRVARFPVALRQSLGVIPGRPEGLAASRRPGMTPRTLRPRKPATGQRFSRPPPDIAAAGKPLVDLVDLQPQTSGGRELEFSERAS
jgi:hypothetical protein